MEFIKDIPDGKQYRAYEHLVDIKENDEIKIQYRPLESKIPGYFVPQVKYFHGSFTADFTMANAIMPQYPDDVELIKEGILLTEKLVEDIKAFMKEGSHD